ncbi:hypothetical protein FEM03_15665 [Phragmitibacter flavus]|uniref:Uncharacterized protein n=1 Tax=Phragmitibacter flavus TaxID=2576071 RepID=A0A5R8KBT3_9BACT|nr:hypothetical protein [Phragmitibacter flavus]TLD69762.1 hypothetical protein FEM03_15665 [Phragmitibacter flavus]
MKSLLTVFIALALLVVVSPASTVFYIGIDNTGTGEFEQEGGGRVDNKYYWENGDYTTVDGISGSVGELWTSGMEPWLDASSILGFARAITSGATTHHIYFQLGADEVGTDKSLTFTVDFYGGGQGAGLPGTTHDIDFYLNDVKFHTVTGMTAAGQLMVVNGIDVSTLSEGEHVLSWVRTGGNAGWINVDYLSLVAVPEPSRALLAMVGCAVLFGGRRKGRF